jgi:hypothetical protein
LHRGGGGDERAVVTVFVEEGVMDERTMKKKAWWRWKEMNGR